MFMRSIVAAAVFSLDRPLLPFAGVIMPTTWCAAFAGPTGAMISRSRASTSSTAVHDGALMRARVEVYHSSFRGRVVAWL